MRDGLRELGYDVGLSETPIIPVMLGDEAVAAIFAGRLRDLGIILSPVMFPAVAQGGARLRICVTAGHCRDASYQLWTRFANCRLTTPMARSW